MTMTIQRISGTVCAVVMSAIAAGAASSPPGDAIVNITAPIYALEVRPLQASYPLLSANPQWQPD